MTKETRSASPLRIDRKTLRSLLKTLERSGVTDFEYEDEHLRLRIGRGGQTVVAAPAIVAAAAPAPQAAQAAPKEAAQDDADFAFITSPFVGTFYKAPSPEAPTFVEVGSLIKPGQTLCIVEAMKLMNEIESDISGTITEVLVENGKAVEYGQKLYKVRRALAPQKLIAMTTEQPLFVAPCVVRFQDVDAAGIMFFARAFDYFHDAYIALLGAHGVHLHEALADKRWSAPLAHAESDYARPLQFGGKYTIEIPRGEVGSSSITLHYVIRGEGGVQHASGKTVHVFIDVKTFRPRLVPDEVKAIFRSLGASLYRQESQRAGAVLPSLFEPLDADGSWLICR